ncbi:protein ACCUMULATION AND REPLICATION OF CHLOROPLASTS 3 isoform X2 [Canna indica]|uniref:Protein ACCUMULATION AND REPLICATION OF CHLOROPLASTS 3 isoform X2 n=1 Tax=Canna indica TaxID=4628 RepID=A0AAQ3L749_9LILI|nr:protein ACCUMULATION AND REPLICATION OF CHLOROPLASTS 3 isoform X2 [Canna indica]
MEALAPRSPFSLSGASPWPGGSCASIPVLPYFSIVRRRRPLLPLRAALSTSSHGGGVELHRSLEPVEVIGIGSRKDAVIDFCLNSPPVSACRLRFWTIQARDSLKVQLLQRIHGTGTIQKDVEFPMSMNPCPPAIILVATSGHGMEHITALELLDAVKSAGGLSVAILLKPFNFEGQRRQKEVEKLEIKLKDCSHFYIVVEADSLLKREAETLAEALETANNAVFLALNTIPIMMSENNLKFQTSPDGLMKEVRPMEMVKLLQSYGEAKVGFGAGYDVKSSIKQAVFHCPFLSDGIKDLNGLVIVTFASGSGVDETDLHSAVAMFRQISECKSEIVVSRVQESHLESNLVITTLLVVGGTQKVASPKKGFLTSLALHFPFLSSLIERKISQPEIDLSVCASECTPDSSSSSENGNISNLGSANDTNDYDNECPQEMEILLSRKESSPEIKSEVTLSECSDDFIHRNSNENENEQQNIQNVWNIGPCFHVAQLWAKECASLQATNKANEMEAFSLPIGVKSSDLCSDNSVYKNLGVPENLDDINSSKELTSSQPIPSRGALTDASLEAVIEIYNSALTLIKGKNLNGSRTGGLLSARAASMLESERESQKNWTRIMEIQYRGGSYRGRCQGGLPEGKGRLTFKDGSFYDGMWRNGKRCGIGTLYYSNGDVFQGSWRDDLMHGKGWFYFRNGDRWFANFWKGKANGEGRFYSKGGSIYFGNFKNGWRHGQSLCIGVDGSRWTEIWEEGILVSRTQLDSAASG